MTVHPFRIDIQQPVLDDLKERLRRTRWASDTRADDWDRGTNPGAIWRSFVRTGAHRFDWRKQQDYLNASRTFAPRWTAFGVHFIHERGKAAIAIPA